MVILLHSARSIRVMNNQKAPTVIAHKKFFLLLRIEIKQSTYSRFLSILKFYLILLLEREAQVLKNAEYL